MSASRAGFTLIELLVVIGILAVLAAALLPALSESQLASNRTADAAQLMKHGQWMRLYQQEHGNYPMGSGHKFVLATWVDGVVEHTRANLETYFNPAQRSFDPRYQELRHQDIDSVWRDLAETTSADTSYAGRRMPPGASLESGREAWMADDNEDGWSFRDGSINILYGDGRVTTLSAMDLKERFGVQQIDPEHPFPTSGAESPHPDLRKLSR